MTLSTILSAIYGSIYGGVFIAVSIYCAVEVKAEIKSKTGKPQKRRLDRRDTVAEDGDDDEDDENDDDGTSDAHDNDKTETERNLEYSINTHNELNEKPKNEGHSLIGSDADTKEDNIDANKANTDIDSGTTSKKGKKGKLKTVWKFLKLWGKSLWVKKSLYLPLIPHVADQATDIATLVEYYPFYAAKDPDFEWFFVFGLAIIIFQRLISSVTIYTMTWSLKSALLQLVDLLLVKAMIVNYKLNLTEPCNPQRYIQILECVFESSPQILLSLGFVTKILILPDVDPANEPDLRVFFMSIVFSLWSITGKVASDDKILINEYNENHNKYRSYNFRKPKIDFKCQGRSTCCFNYQPLVRIVLFRFFEITTRVALLLLVWMIMGGLSLLIILMGEFMFLLVICYIEKAPDAMANMMYLSLSFNYEYLTRFRTYRIFSCYVILVLVTILMNVDSDVPTVPAWQHRMWFMNHEISAFYKVVHPEMKLIE